MKRYSAISNYNLFKKFTKYANNFDYAKEDYHWIYDNNRKMLLYKCGITAMTALRNTNMYVEYNEGSFRIKRFKTYNKCSMYSQYCFEDVLQAMEFVVS